MSLETEAAELSRASTAFSDEPPAAMPARLAQRKLAYSTEGEEPAESGRLPEVRSVPRLRESFFTRSQGSTLRFGFTSSSPTDPPHPQSTGTGSPNALRHAREEYAMGSAGSEAEDNAQSEARPRRGLDQLKSQSSIHDFLETVVSRTQPSRPISSVHHIGHVPREPRISKGTGRCCFCFHCDKDGRRRYRNSLEARPVRPLQNKFHEPPLAHLAIVPFICGIQIAWDVIKNVSGALRGEPPLIHVMVMLILTLAINAFMLGVLYGLRRGFIASKHLS